VPDIDSTHAGLRADSAVAEIVRYSATSVFHTITVTDVGFRRVLAFGRHPQSSMYLDDPYETDFEYPSYFHLALAITPDATRALAIGLGGGTVVKRMWRDYPEMRVDAVELDAEVVDVAKRFFVLPDDPRVRVIVDEGSHFIETAVDTYDIVVVDAFEDDRIPAQLTTDSFLRAVRDRMSEGGVIVYNLIGSLTGERSEPFRSLYRALSSAWRQVWVFSVDEGVEAEGGNLVLLASDATLSAEDLRARITDRVGGRVSVPAFHLFGEDLQ
jgi:spermidine synthase